MISDLLYFIFISPFVPCDYIISPYRYIVNAFFEVFSFFSKKIPGAIFDRLHPASNFGIIKTGPGFLGKMFRIPCFMRQARGELSATIVADFLGFVKQKFDKLEGFFLDELYQDMIRHLKQEVQIWRTVAFLLAVAVIILLIC